ncbi:MAG: OmpH family outer membrane protein [Calditrichaeota bacterium]|nr:MAG: OmpH family outer membrane protein [Calditrichota bacterium]
MSRITYLIIATFLTGVFLLFNQKPAAAQLKIGYINSQKILDTYKEALDVKKQLQELNAKWEKEARDMEQEIKELQDQLESQSLLLSEERKKQKQEEIQNLYTKYQQFLKEKWGPQGEAARKEAELIKPVYDKINAAIKKIGDAEGFNYIFDVVAGSILYASEDQPDLTDRLLEELNKGLAATTGSGNNK